MHASQSWENLRKGLTVIFLRRQRDLGAEMPYIKGLLNRIKIPPSPSYNLCRRKLEKLVEGLSREARILDLGSGGRKLREGVISLDISPEKGVDIVGDAFLLPFWDASFDLIVCTALLEHILRPEAMISEMHRCCRKGGLVYAEVPFLQGYHKSPEDYWRCTLPGLVEAFKSFEKQEAGVCCGPASALAMFLAMLPYTLFTSPFLRKLGLFFFGWTTFYLKYLDIFFARVKGAHYLAAAFYYLGRKP